MSAELLLEEARKLSVAERLRLVEELWDSIGGEQEDLAVTAEQREELDRRLADLAANPDAGSPWPEVRARLERKL
jgi:putative addiction module component (TIGR02574 family)